MTFEYEHLPHYLSLGAGVQSSTLALMYACGELQPMPKAAIFADTQAETEKVYDWLDWLHKQLPFPVHRVTKGNIETHTLTKKRSSLPLYTVDENGEPGVLKRGCTYDFKIVPLLQKQRELAKVPRGCKTPWLVSVIGISLDEYQRMKPSRDAWSVNRWPLVEKRIRRRDCLAWMHSHGYPEPPRSACRWCPFKRNKEWRRLQKHEPHEFAKAVEFDRAIREDKEWPENMRSTVYLHQDRKPLDQIDFRSDVERGQQLLWDDECEGMCGV